MEFSGRTIIHSNRPPTSGAAGGAQEVIEASSPTWWVGPQSVSNTVWDAMSQGERSARTLHGDPDADEKPNYDLQTFVVPDLLTDKQYKTISNEILWPLAHSMLPNTDKNLEEIEAAYFGGYLEHNELANNALRGMVEEYELTGDDRIWVHDYQCDNVPGTLYSRHIPWPSVEFLEGVELKTEKGDDVSLLDTHFFRDLVELSSSRVLSTFQRPIDQVNFIMTAAVLAGKSENFPDQFSLESDTPLLQNIGEDIHDNEKRTLIQKVLLEELKENSVYGDGIGTMTHLTLFGSRTSLMNVPVGQVTENTYAHAKDSEDRLNKTRFKFENGKYAVFNADIGGGKTANLTACDENDFDKHNPPLLSDLVEPIRNRDWIMSAHRNDYTKGTLTKLEAADEVLAEYPNTTFLFMLQPTREDVGGYKDYAEHVFAKAIELREKYGEKSVVIIPEGVKHDEVLGLMRQPEIHGFMGLGHKDGHDLTVREVVDSNDEGRAIGVITSSGIGATDVLGNGDKGSFVIDNPTDAHEVATALKQMLDVNNVDQLRERFDYMKARSRQYDAANFSDIVDEAYMIAMEHRFGEEDIRSSFIHPNGKYMDRRGHSSSLEAGATEYIKELLVRKIGDHTLSR